MNSAICIATLKALSIARNFVRKTFLWLTFHVFAAMKHVRSSAQARKMARVMISSIALSAAAAPVYADCTVSSKSIEITAEPGVYPFDGGQPGTLLNFTLNYASHSSNGRRPACGTQTITVTPTSTPTGPTFSPTQCEVTVVVPLGNSISTGSCALTWTAPPNPAASYSISAYATSAQNGDFNIQVEQSAPIVLTRSAGSNEAPVITLLGAASITLEIGTPFLDPGATALDAEDGDLTASIITGGQVETDTIGTYTLTYDVTDSSGNAAAQLSRMVTVTDTTAPVITVIGDSLVTLLRNAAYVDAGASCTDNADDSCTVITSGTVDSSTAGTYTLTYSATDSSGNTAQATRIVQVIEGEAPVITLLGAASVTLEIGTPFLDPGATALDAEDGDLTASIVTGGQVETDTIGTYTLTYDVTDSSGNAAAQLSRMVTVTDTTAPVITGVGNMTVVISGDVSELQSKEADGEDRAEIIATFFENGARVTTGGRTVWATTDLGTLSQNPSGPSIPMRDNQDGSYTVFLTSTAVGVATVTISLDGPTGPEIGEALVTFAHTAVADVIEATQDAISSFMLGRANDLAVNQPRLTRFLRGEGCGSFSANGTDAGGSLHSCVSGTNTWAEVTAAWGDGSTYVLGTLGAHQFLNPNLLVGGMIQFDHAKDDRNKASGTGWMVGPYFAARLAEQPLYFEGRLLYGQTDNKISPLGTYTDSFTTRRWLAQFRVEGEIRQESITWLPLLDFTHSKDRSSTYTDSLGNVIASQSISVTQVTAGLDFSMPLRTDHGRLELLGGASVIHSSNTGGNADFKNNRGRLHLGMNWNSGRGTALNMAAFYDGLGSSRKSYGGSLGYRLRF